MTAVLPRPPVVSETDQLRRERDNLRLIVAALLDVLVNHDLVLARNYGEHPRTDAELDELAEASRERHTLTALAAINAKDQP